MTKFFEFIVKHWILVSLFVCALVFWIAVEIRIRKHGAKKLSLQAAITLLNHQNGIIVDVRNLAEYNKGHVQGALHAPLSTLSSAISSFKPYQQRPIIVACQTGFQAPAACTMLRKAGFNTLYYLDGGMNAWMNDRLPMVKK